MARWLVDVTADIPYPWTRSFTIDRSGMGPAASEAVKRYRKAVKEKCKKAKHFDTLKLSITRAPEIDPE